MISFFLTFWTAEDRCLVNLPLIRATFTLDAVFYGTDSIRECSKLGDVTMAFAKYKHLDCPFLRTQNPLSNYTHFIYQIN